jgi:hypothetical protein
MKSFKALLSSSFITHILLLAVVCLLSYNTFFEDEASKEVTSIVKADKQVIKSVEDKEINHLIAKRLEELKSEAPLTKSENADELLSSSEAVHSSPMTTSGAPNQSCYVTVGNYSQPKFAFDKDCNPLSKKLTEKKTSLTLTKLPDNFTANFKAENETDVIYVFTDYTCPYCRKLHANIAKFNAEGVTVKYIQFPRALDYGERYAEKAKEVVAQMSNAWCAPNQEEAFHDLYSKRTVPEYTCDRDSGRIPPPMREHYTLSHMIDIQHTPAIVSSSGKLSYGFSSVARTLNSLGL